MRERERKREKEEEEEEKQKVTGMMNRKNAIVPMLLKRSAS